ncbi:MAG: DUF6232 family protein [Chloroflexota bacterium]|nr:DUF6232 family protein [Chloroflexota bacterium]MDQ5864250.1 DUF6232 family protein [Chloroflexota bacterium]
MQTTLTSELVYYGDGAVWVTSQRFVVGEKSYGLHEFDSVEVGKVPGEQWADIGQGRFNWAWLVIPLWLLAVPFRIGPNPLPLALAVLTTLFIIAAMWRYRSKKPQEPVLKPLPVYVIKARGTRLRHIVFASLDEEHTNRLADLIMEAAEAHRRGESPHRVMSRASFEPPRGNAHPLSLATYFMDGLVWVTSEVVHVGRQSYPLHTIRAVYVHQGRIDWYTADAADGYFVIANIHDTLTPILATTDPVYAYKVRDAIKAVLKIVGQNHLRRSL